MATCSTRSGFHYVDRISGCRTVQRLVCVCVYKHTCTYGVHGGSSSEIHRKPHVKLLLHPTGINSHIARLLFPYWFGWCLLSSKRITLKSFPSCRGFQSMLKNPENMMQRQPNANSKVHWIVFDMEEPTDHFRCLTGFCFNEQPTLI